MRLRDRTVWITGASSGIGEALAYEAARRGARLILSARREAELERVRRACDRPDTHVVHPLDLSDASAAPAAAEALAAQGVEVDVLIHSSGLSQRSLVTDTALAVDRRLMELNYFAAVALTKALLPGMLDRGGGHLVAISSVAGKIGVPQRSAYCASKHALHGFFGAVRAELFDRGIRVTLACPGYVRTQVSANALSGDGTPFGRTDENIAAGIDPERCARSIADGVERDREEVVVGGKETYAVLVQRLWPSLASRLVRRVAAQRVEG